MLADEVGLNPIDAVLPSTDCGFRQYTQRVMETTRSGDSAGGDAASFRDRAENSDAGMDFEGRKCVVSGSGNVAIYTIEKIRQFGGIVIACSDSNGYIVDENGIDLDLVKEIKEVRRERIARYARMKCNGTHYIDSGSIWDVPCDVAMPSATQNELTGKDARALVKNGVVAVGEGANMPCTPDAVRVSIG